MGIRQLLLSGVWDASVSSGGDRTPTPQYQANSLIAPASVQVPTLSGTANSFHSRSQKPRAVGEAVCIPQREVTAFPRVEMPGIGRPHNIGEVGNGLFFL